MDEIIEIVCNYYRISLETLISKERKREVAQARFICYFFIRRSFKTSLEAIGAKFERNHASVIHGIKKADFFYETDDKFRRDIENLWEKIEPKVRKIKVSQVHLGMYKTLINRLVNENPVAFLKLIPEESERQLILKDLRINEEQLNFIPHERDEQENKERAGNF